MALLFLSLSVDDILSIEDTEFDRVINFAQLLDHVLIIFLIDVGDHITDRFVRLQVLTNNVDSIGSQNMIYLCQDSRYIVVNVNQTVRIAQQRQC